MQEGTVKWYNDAKGFGFIAGPSQDVFVHVSAVKAAGLPTLVEGQSVKFDISEGPAGKPVALNLKIASKNEAPAKMKTQQE